MRLRNGRWRAVEGELGRWRENAIRIGNGIVLADAFTGQGKAGIGTAEQARRAVTIMRWCGRSQLAILVRSANRNNWIAWKSFSRSCRKGRPHHAARPWLAKWFSGRGGSVARRGSSRTPANRRNEESKWRTAKHRDYWPKGCFVGLLESRGWKCTLGHGMSMGHHRGGILPRRTQGAQPVYARVVPRIWWMV